MNKTPSAVPAFLLQNVSVGGAAYVDETQHHLQISRIYPLLLFVVSLLLIAVPSNATFLVASLVAAIIGLRNLYLQALRPGNLRFTWLIATGLLLGYGLGSFNTASQVALEGWTISRSSGRDENALCIALAVSLLVGSFLYFVGPLLEASVRLPWASIHQDRSNRILIWASLGMALAALVLGKIGFMGIQVQAGEDESIIGALSAILTPVLPAYTVLCFKKNRQFAESLVFRILIGGEFALLLLQGRRVMIYSAVIFFLAHTLRGDRIRLARVRTIFLLIVAASALYFGSKLFYAMRYQRNLAGRRASVGLVENLRGGLASVQSGNDRLSASLGNNLRDRTFVLTYFSDLLDATWSRPLMWGRALLFNFRMAVPAFLDPNKDEVRVFGSEEVVVNPEFGLRVEDDANSILTTGLADFGLVGCFLYPLCCGLFISVFFRKLCTIVPTELAGFVFLSLTFLLIQVEVATIAYFAQMRNLVLICVIFWLVKSVANRRRSAAWQ